MSMVAPMIFLSDDWKNKLTQAQRNKFKIRAKAQGLQNNHNSTPSSTYNSNMTQSQLSPSPPATPPVLGNRLRHMQLNSHSRALSQVNTVQYWYSIHHIEVQSPGSIIDGVVNGGLGGSDFCIMRKTPCTAGESQSPT
jgi:hypothetical protein